jgi:small basic protein
VKVLLADVMIHSVDAALQVSEVAFGGIRADLHAIFDSDVLFLAVVHLVVLGIIGAPSIRQRDHPGHSWMVPA